MRLHLWSPQEKAPCIGLVPEKQQYPISFIGRYVHSLGRSFPYRTASTFLVVVAYRALFEPTCTLQPVSVPSPGHHGLDSLIAGEDYQIPGRCCTLTDKADWRSSKCYTTSTTQRLPLPARWLFYPESKTEVLHACIRSSSNTARRPCSPSRHPGWAATFVPQGSWKREHFKHEGPHPGLWCVKGSTALGLPGT
ncbi:hypothetical protein IG631_07953 [Alternaria alternata]|nr:hypothetical protein IG631_07953 [Alternaria alternata]